MMTITLMFPDSSKKYQFKLRSEGKVCEQVVETINSIKIYLEW